MKTLLYVVPALAGFLKLLNPKRWVLSACLCLLAGSAPAVGTASRDITLNDFKLTAILTNGQAEFILTATAQVESRKGGVLELLSGPVAVTGINSEPKWRLQAEPNRFLIAFNRAGKFPLRVQFNSAVRQADGWSSVNFRVTPSALQPLVIQGLPEDTQFTFSGARPERTGSDFKSYLPADGSVQLSWKEGRPEAEGKLFYSAQMLSEISISPGLMRQVALLDFKVMQGELNKVTLLLRGAGEVTRVQGEDVLAWNVGPSPGAERRLVIQFNQPQKVQFTLLVQLQTPLAAFPQTTEPFQLRPESATRFAGYYRVVNEGAVRLEVLQASGLSQISPEQFPESDATRAALRATGKQRFVYRFSSTDYSMRIQADQVLPELAVSEVLGYHLAENELAIDGEFELDIREAPLRELLLRIPKGYAVARLTAGGMSDYFVREPEGETNAELRLVFGQPVSGRHVVQVRLERNKPLVEAGWALPRVEVTKSKSVRGHVAVSADAGFRLTPERTQGLTEVATAFFPRKVTGIQAAFRLNEPAWEAVLRVERLPQTVQADVLHLFSVGEGIAYGSSVMNYVISGAPVSAFKLELSDEYFNVEFTGKDIRNWQKTDTGYIVQLHTPVSGAYTLLATYERPFKAQGETLTFTGARPLDAQSEQGHTIIISAYQFQVTPADVSPGLLPLETGEVPAEYRLFFDAPILAAYRYAARPFNLRLALSPLAQGESLSQVVDRAAFTTRISKEGQVLTEARYFLKNRGNPNLRLTLPPDTRLWSATVNGTAVVPVTDATANLIPMPHAADPNAVLTIELKLASRSKEPARVGIAAPIVNAPVMLAEWLLQPDTGQCLTYRSGSLTPAGTFPDNSGFGQVVRAFTGPQAAQAFIAMLAILVSLTGACVLWNRASRSANGARHISLLVGFLGLGLAGVAFVVLANLLSHQQPEIPRELTFVAPVQQAGSALQVEVSNLPDETSLQSSFRYAWPALLALALWIYAWLKQQSVLKSACNFAGWLLLAWAALRSPNGALPFLGVLALFIAARVVIPAVRELWRASRPEAPAPSPGPDTGATSTAAGLLLFGFAWFAMHSVAFAQPGPANQQAVVQQVEPVLAQSPSPGAGSSPRGERSLPDASQVVADSVLQEVRIEEKFALATAKIRWQAEKGQSLPLLLKPAVLTGIHYPSNSLRLARGPVDSQAQLVVLAKKAGNFEIELQFQLQLSKPGTEASFSMPLPYGLVNRLNLTLVNMDVDVFSPQAVSVQRQASGSNTVATLVLSPAAGTCIGWKPRSRDVKSEKSVFYAEFSHLYVPSAGAIEGTHLVSIRPAQGEISELVMDVPSGATISDVLDPSRSQVVEMKTQNAASRQIVSLWRFDPDAHKLRITLNPPQSRPFALLVRSQVAAGPLPFSQTVGVLSLENAAGQLGLLGVATGNEVQIDNLAADGLSSVNLEDYPGELTASLQGQFPGLTVRRAFRYTDSRTTAVLKASAVEPDVRVETQDTVSLGEDRTVLAGNATVEVTRAGIFRLSFLLPVGFDVESISGPVLSHWTELKTDAGRVITLHLNGKTEGKQQFAIGLAGPGVKSAANWLVPQLVFREAAKQRGTLLLVPEQGLRLQVASAEGLTQLDPEKSGIKQKGVLAFRVLQTARKLALNVEQVDAWIQVNSLQHATVNEAQVKVAANLQYQIENTGLKALHVYLPTNAEGVRFQAEQIADFLPVSGANTNGLQEWEIKLSRRVIGSFLLQANYQVAIPDKASDFMLRGVQAGGVNLQRGFVTLQAGGRLQVRADTTPPSLQPAEWQSIPRALQQGLPAVAANFSYRLVETGFDLPLKLERHEAAKLLAARVNNITLNSVISEDGVMLTQVRLELLPGDKRLLYLTLPKAAHFWFAFVNENGVWPWREQDRILIPLEQQSRVDKPTPVELFYTCQVSAETGRQGRGRSLSGTPLDLELFSPKFDLPLENITWRVSLSDKWRVKHWAGSLQLQREEAIAIPASVNLQSYLQNEATQQRQRTKEAEDLLSFGNNALLQGEPQQARRAFQAAYGLSAHDAAFNEDARVQLHNIKLQQTLIGLNVRQAVSAGEPGGVAGKLRDLRARKEANYTQQDAKEIIERNNADDNASFMRLAEKLVQQQDAAVSSPAALRASIPEQGRVLTFKRAVLVDPWADLKLELETSVVGTAKWMVRAAIIAATMLVLAIFGRMGSRRATREERR